MYQVCEKAPRSHTQLILPMVKDCLGHGKLKAKNLDALAFGCGPGSFTGIRIATGIAQGLAYGSDCHIYACLLYTSPSPRDKRQSRMPSSA